MGQMKDLYMQMLQKDPAHIQDMNSQFEFEAWYKQVRENKVVAFSTDASGQITMLHAYSVENLYEIAAKNHITEVLELVFPFKIVQ
jgi:hypothetical protein